MINNPYFHKKDEIVEDNYPVAQQAVEQPSMEVVKGMTSIIIPAFFNSYPIFHQTGNCIGAIREHTDKIKTPYEIILVINGNTGIGWLDADAGLWNGNKPKEAHVDKIVANKENLGYAKAINQGIRSSSGEYLVFMNNDCMVFDHWLEDMQEALQYADLVEATPMYGNPYARAVEAEEYRSASFDKNWLKVMKEKDPNLYPFVTDFNNLTPEQLKEPATIEDTLTTFRDFSCVLTTRDVLSHVGLFNEDFFAYGEDLDLIRRIEKAGGKVTTTARVRTFHIISMTASETPNMPEIMDQSTAKLHEIWKE